jgi:thioredoxin-like negative regulator of GroEL
MVEGPYEDLSHRYSGANFLKVDVDQHQGISSTAGVTAMPTFQVFELSYIFILI